MSAKEKKSIQNRTRSKQQPRMGVGGGTGTELFPELGTHCQHPECIQLDYLPFKCDGCSNIYCLEHRTYKSHDCPKAEHKSRRVVVCQICSTSMEAKTGTEKKEFKEEEKMLLEKHEKSGDCDPSKKKKPSCPVKNCEVMLIFSNVYTCRSCQMKVCLGHRFPSDHECKKRVVSSVGSNGGGLGNKFSADLVGRTCGSKMNNSIAASMVGRNAKACG